LSKVSGLAGQNPPEQGQAPDAFVSRPGLGSGCWHLAVRARDRDYWQKKLREAEAELEAARKRTEVDAAAARLQRAKAALKRLEAEEAERRRLAVVPARRALPHNLLGFVDHKPRLLEMLDHPLG
jgi:hypothetical protein